MCVLLWVRELDVAIAPLSNTPQLGLPQGLPANPFDQRPAPRCFVQR